MDDKELKPDWEQANEAYEAERDEAYKEGWRPGVGMPTAGEYLRSKKPKHPTSGNPYHDNNSGEFAEAREVFGLPEKKEPAMSPLDEIVTGFANSEGLDPAMVKDTINKDPAMKKLFEMLAKAK